MSVNRITFICIVISCFCFQPSSHAQVYWPGEKIFREFNVILKKYSPSDEETIFQTYKRGGCSVLFRSTLGDKNERIDRFVTLDLSELEAFSATLSDEHNRVYFKFSPLLTELRERRFNPRGIYKSYPDQFNERTIDKIMVTLPMKYSFSPEKQKMISQLKTSIMRIEEFYRACKGGIAW